MPVTLTDDQLHAAGWEIANEDYAGSPEPLTKEGQLPSPAKTSCGKEHLRCSICSNAYKFLKPLGCQCKVCAHCADRILMQSADDTREMKKGCPICGQEQVVKPSMFRTQKPIFGDGALKCMSCSGQKEVQDGWWCVDCSAILCSKCTHKLHRDHQTMEFDQDYEPVRFCLSMLHAETRDVANRFKTITWGKLEEIFKVVEGAIDAELDRQSKVRRAVLTDVFGQCHGTQNGENGGDNVHKRFSATERKAKGQYPMVLDEILTMTGLDGKDTINLKTDVVAERVIGLLKSAVNQLSTDVLKIEEEKQEPEKEELEKQEPKSQTNLGVQMHVGEYAPETDPTSRYYLSGGY